MVYCVVVSSTGNSASVPPCEGSIESFQSNPQQTNEFVARINHHRVCSHQFSKKTL